MSKHYRRGATFASAWGYPPPDRNQRAKIMYLAEITERKTKPEGKKNGALGGPCGLQVLRALLFGFMNFSTGRCDPSYSELEDRTGYCRDTIANCIQALESSGLLLVTRRMVRVVVNGVRMARQISNAYGFGELRLVARQTTSAAAEKRGFPPKREVSVWEKCLNSLRSNGAKGASLNHGEQLPLDLKTRGFQREIKAGGALHG